MRLLGFGDCTMDISLDDGMMYPGGQALNAAVNARLCGAEAGFLGCLGSDAPAAHILRTLDAIGVDHSRCRIFPVPNEYWYYVRMDGDRVFLPAEKLHKSPLTAAMRDMLAYEGLSAEDERYLDTFDVVHASDAGRVESLLPALAARRPKLSFDLSQRYRDGNSLRQVCKYADIVLLSYAGMAERDVAALLASACEAGAEVALATRGGDAAICFDGRNYRAQPCVPGTRITDTLGAGDAFIGAFLTRLFARDPGPGAEGSRDIGEALVFAAHHAAKICDMEGSFGYGTAWHAQPKMGEERKYD